MEKVLNKIIKYSLYSLVFLLPLFFLPWTTFPMALNKQMLLAVFAFFLLLLWIIKIISTGKLSFRWNKLTGFVLLFLLVLGVSTAFSGARAQSFWGMSFEPNTLFSFLLYGLIFLLFANLISINQLKSVLISVLASSGVLAVLFLIQAFWRPIFPWDFAKTAGFNPLGTVQGLAIFLGGAFVILMTLINTDKKPINADKKTDKKISVNQPSSAKISGLTLAKRLASILPIALGILLFTSILIINYWVAWLLIVFSTTIIIWARLKTISSPAQISKKLGRASQPKSASISVLLPLIILAVALIFIFIKVPTSNIVSLPAEITPTYGATFDISKATLNEGPKNFILGSGPATFGYDYDLHRSVGPNLTAFWQVRFSQGAAFLPTLLATGGILGLIGALLLMAIFFYFGFRSLMSATPKMVHVPIFVGGTYFLISWFFYPANLTLMAAAFLMLGLFTAISGNQPSSAKISGTKEFSFVQSPQKAFFVMLICVFLIVGVAVGFYNLSQKYRAALASDKGLNLINAPEPKLDEAIMSINKAAILDKKDTYFRNLSQILILKINEVLNDQELSQEDKQKFLQQLVQNAELSANNAVLINPVNSQNWLQQASVYENFLVVGVEGAAEMAISSYQKAQELAPQNPMMPLSLGRVYKSIGERIQIQIALSEQAEEKDEEAIKQLEENRDKVLEMALQEFEESIQLKIDFTPAYFLMAQVYELQENKELALQNYQIVLLLEPGNEEVQAKIEELSQ